MLKRENQILTGLSFLHTILLCSCFYFLPVCFWQMETALAAKYVLRCSWLLIPAAASWWGIRKLKGFFMYVLLAAVCTGILYLITRCYLTAGLSAAIFLVRCYVRIKKGKIKKMMQELPGEIGAGMDRELWEIPTLLDCPKMVHWSLFCAIYAVLIVTQNDGVLRWVFWLLLAEIMVCFFYNYVDRMQWFIKEKQHIANLPGRAVRRISWMVLGIGLVLLTVFVIPAVLYNEEPLTKIHFKPAEVSAPVEEMTAEPGGESMAEMLADLAGEPEEPPKWLAALTEIIQYVLMVLVGIGVLIGACIACKYVLRSFADGVEEEDEVIFLGEDSQETLPRNKARRKAGESWNSPNKKIRRKYKKVIVHGRKQRPSGWESPTELEQSTDLSRIADGEKFHALYEKARYSRKGCTKEEAQEYGG